MKEDHAYSLEEGQAGRTTKFLDFTLTLKELISSIKRTHNKAKTLDPLPSSPLEVEPIFQQLHLDLIKAISRFVEDPGASQESFGGEDPGYCSG